MIILNIFYRHLHKLWNMLNTVYCTIFWSHKAHCCCQISSSTTHVKNLFRIEKKLMKILKSIGMHMRSRYGCAITQGLWRVHIWMGRSVILSIDLLHGFRHFLGLNNAFTHQCFDQFWLVMIHSKFNHYKT